MDYYYDGGAIAMFATLAVFGFIFVIAAYVLTSLFLMKIFDKAGVQGRWRAWIPVYNSMVFLKLADMSPWLILYAVGASILLSWVPVIGQIIGLAAFAVMVVAAYRVGQKLQKEGAWVVLYIFLSIVWLGINAFDKSRWNTQIAPAPWAGNAFLADNTVWDGVPVQATNVPPAGAPGYGSAPQGYAPPQPGQAPAAPGYGQPPAPGYTPPAAAPATPPVTPPPAAPPAPPTTPPAPPAPPTTPPAPPAPPEDPSKPQV